MANGRNNGKAKKNPVTVRGPWLAMPLDFLRSRACAELSNHAARMLLDLCSMLGPNAKGNGDISAAPAVMKPRGWSSNASRNAAIQELIDAKLLVVTRRGNRRLCALYAVTLWPLSCDLGKLDYGPGAFTTLDWEDSGSAKVQPTEEAPAKRNSLRKIEMAYPATGQPKPDITPPRGKVPAKQPAFNPATGHKGHVLGHEVTPPRGTFLDKPSVALGLGCCVAPSLPQHGQLVDAMGIDLGVCGGPEPKSVAQRPSSSTAKPLETCELERVRESEQDPSGFDPETGEFVDTPPAPARAAKAGAQRWVASELHRLGKGKMTKAEADAWALEAMLTGEIE